VPLVRRYNDCGFTRASLDRPALRQLLAGVEAGSIDCVVVYKVGRLSRSLPDFARLTGLFADLRSASCRSHRSSILRRRPADAQYPALVRALCGAWDYAKRARGNALSGWISVLIYFA
jgi:hypothetical protein